MRTIAAPIALLAALGLPACGSEWSVIDIDGDGYTTADGDCWDAIEGPPGTGLSGAQISPDATETWYDGIDQDCKGDDDYDADGDGFVPLEEYLGRGTLGVPGAGGHLGAGDCWDAPAGVVEAQFEALNGLDQIEAAAVFPGAEPMPSMTGSTRIAMGRTTSMQTGMDSRPVTSSTGTARPETTAMTLRQRSTQRWNSNSATTSMTTAMA